MEKEKINIFWFRRDLRLDDNTALFHALQSSNKVLAVFIFDTFIIDKLNDIKDARIWFIYNELKNLKKCIEKYGSTLLIKKGVPIDIFKEITTNYDVEKVFANRDYEPFAIKRDKILEDFFKSYNIEFLLFKDQVIFEKDEILKSDSKPYTVFGFYKKSWLKKFYEQNLDICKSEGLLHNLLIMKPINLFDLSEIGFYPSYINFPTKEIDLNIIDNYDKTRDIPALSTSGLGLHLRFGTISIRKVFHIAQTHNDVWMSELIWREFFMQILHAFPYVENSAFKPIYNNIEWLNNESDFEHWCNGKTGYAIVDAGMRELNATGFMHNRVRMVVASFLCKHLLIDWRWGEAYFASKLLDYELSSNNGNWQWAAGCGCDAAPYFRIFNPISQTQKFDPQLIYVRKWVKEFNELSYNYMIDHKFARERCLSVYKKIF